MDPAQIEFISEKESISILPNFTEDKLYLISGEVGPFQPQVPVRVPLWLAANLKQRQKCRIITPEWMDVELLKEKKAEELEGHLFSIPLHPHFLELSTIILGISDEVKDADEVRTLIKDIWDVRAAKLRKSVNKMINHDGGGGKPLTHVEINNITVLELNTIRGFFTASLDHLHNLRNHAELCLNDPRYN
ncbi:DNA replication complex GINS protein PSF2-like [Bolinopsis microptera]|uniref:DNA replication complex GINS protein PSF2-like n=1 Tax=Bolinopsis microptera TaxID=2820187 RepID=UPI00307AABAB